jgi:hypothetical protein
LGLPGVNLPKPLAKSIGPISGSLFRDLRPLQKKQEIPHPNPHFFHHSALGWWKLNY